MPASRTSTRAAIRRLAATIYAVALIVAASVVLDGQRGTGPPPPRPKPLIASAAPARSCESLRELTLTDTTIEAASVDAGTDQVPASCRVTAIVAHPSTRDRIRIWIALPVTDWNGRFQGVGGGGFSGGNPNGVAQPLRAGYAAGSTDTGHEGGSGSFALDANGRLDWEAIRDNVYAGIHEMTVVGKALTARLLWHARRDGPTSTGVRPAGGRDSARRSGIRRTTTAFWPARRPMNWTKLHVEQLWGALMMLETNTVVPSCKFAAATAAAVAACDGLDGVKDGVLENPRACTFDPKALVGTAPATAARSPKRTPTVIRAIWEGPRRRDGSFLWHGLERGADFSGLSGTGGTPLAPRPNGITLDWWRYFLTQDPQWSWTSLTRASYERYWDQSVEQFGAVFATDNPDLTAFKARGGKIVMWHGWSDQLIYPGGSIDYYTRVQQAMGGAAKTAEFLRFFLAPGVAHCGGGPGPAPSGQFEAMVRWVEEGKAPETLDAVRRDPSGAVVRSRPLCQYPKTAHYKGRGSTDAARTLSAGSGAIVPSKLTGAGPHPRASGPRQTPARGVNSVLLRAIWLFSVPSFFSVSSSPSPCPRSHPRPRSYPRRLLTSSQLMTFHQAAR